MLVLLGLLSGMDSILVVEDADTLREVLALVLESEGFRVVSSASAEEAWEVLQRDSFSCIVADFNLPEMNGIDLLVKVREINPVVPFMMMTAFGSVEIVAEAMKKGANEFISKPFEPERICSAVREVIDHRRIIERSFGSSARRDRKFLSVDPGVEKLLSQARKFAAVDSSVLILGESGTGKELLARYIHEHSPRKDKPFVAVNCAAMPADLLESEFFGHEAGSFTGATQSRVGVFELASEGTIFLDELGEMPPRLQVKLLRALQEREIRRLGGSKSIKVNPRILAATNHEIDEALNSGTLREDLYYRIAVISFTIPALRSRVCDIDLLASYFLNYFSSQTGKQLRVSEDAWEMLRSYQWPGNARELENVIERAVILAQEEIRPEHLGVEPSIDFAAIEESSRTLTEIAGLAARSAEISVMKKALERAMGNKSKAAQALGVSYKTMLNKVKEYRL